MHGDIFAFQSGDHGGDFPTALVSTSDRHAYPGDLASAAYHYWDTAYAGGRVRLAPPDRVALEQAISICYQASLLEEEGRAVTFRVAFGPADAFAGAEPAAGLHGLVFTRPRRLDEHELRRLAPAAAFARSLIGASLDVERGPEIWGLIHSGPQWLASATGGRQAGQTIPPILIVSVTGPGRVLVSVGTIALAVLSQGTLVARTMDVFEAAWMQDVFADMGGTQWAAHVKGRDEATEAWATLNARFGPALARHVLRRVLTTVRSARHGGLLIIVPEHRAADMVGPGRYVNLKYQFLDTEPRRRILSLTVEIMNELARLHDAPTGQATVGWNEYEASQTKPLLDMDYALFEVAHLIADLTHVDGAVVMTNRLELLGFGGEIAGGLPEVPTVGHALDLGGTERDWVQTDQVGTRHRAAYRLCQQVRDALAVVASQDGGLRFVRWHHGAVTYWDQVETTPLEA